MDYELSLVPASQSVQAGATTSFDIYFTNNTQNDVTTMGIAITSSGSLVPENATEEGGVIYGEATIETYNQDIIGQCALTVNDAEYGNYFSITLEPAENSNAVISTGKIATVTITLANDVVSPLDLEFGVDGGGYTSYGYVVADTDVELTEENTTVTDASITVAVSEPTTADIISSMATNIANAYTVIAERDGTIPQNKNLENLADAIDTLPSIEPEPTPTSMSYFMASGNTLTGYTGTLSEIVIPKSYSKTETLISVTGGKLNDNRSVQFNFSAPYSYATFSFTDGTTTKSLVIPANANTPLALNNWLSNNFSITPVITSIVSVTGNYVVNLFFQLCQYNWFVYPFTVRDNINNQDITFSSITDVQTYYSSHSSGSFNFSFTNTVSLVSTTFIDGNDYQITNIGNEVFKGDINLTKVTMLDNITTLGEGVFRQCTLLKEVIFSNSLTSIPTYTCYNCPALFTVNIPENITTIGNYAFGSCNSLTNIFIPKNVSSISSYAFNGCPSLSAISVDNQNTIYDSRNNCNCLIATATNQLLFGSANSIIPNTVVSIGNNAFRENKALTTITIPSSVTTIGDYAFYNCTSLQTVTVLASVTSVGNWAFGQCRSLITLLYYATATELPVNIFYGCAILPSFTIPGAVTYIKTQAFIDCKSLTTLTVPSTVTNIDANILKNCTSLQTVNINATSSTTKVTSASASWFNGCNPNLVLHIPSSVTDPATAYGTYWNYYSSSGTLTYYADL